MPGRLKRAAMRWCPPALVPVARSVLIRCGLLSANRLQGRYANWELASRASTTYAAAVIADRVARSVARVLAGEAACERDSVLFADMEWPWPLLAALGRQAACEGGSLRVLDFGGSLGGTFLVARRFLPPQVGLRWHVVEQAQYVAKAAQLAFPPEIEFFTSIASATESFTPQVVIASGVLHYLPQPFEVLAELASLGAAMLVIDRTPCTSAPDDVITVQRVPPEIFPASYPSWLFSLARFTAALPRGYRQVAFFDGADSLIFEGMEVRHTGWILEKTAGAPLP